MPTIHTSNQLAKRLTKYLDPSAKGHPAKPLDCFYADSFTVERRQCWIVVHDPTCFAVLLPGITATNIKDIGQILAQALENQLAHEKISIPTDYLAQIAANTSLARTHGNRSLIGTLKEFRTTLEYRRHGHPHFATFPWVEIAATLNHFPSAVPKGWPQLSERSFGYPTMYMRNYLDLIGVETSVVKPRLPDFLEVALASKPVSLERQYAAQDLYYDSFEVRTFADQQQCYQLALKQDPRNVNVLLLRLQALPQSAKLIPVYRKLLELAKEDLGEEFEELRGAFWGFIETRPYMRTRAALAEALAKYSNEPAARDEYLAMIELNPNDNQGLRYTLAPLLIAQQDWPRYEELQAKFPDDGDPGWLWGNVFAAVLKGEPNSTIELLRKEADKRNPYVFPLLLGSPVRDEELPTSHLLGTLDEAKWAAHNLRKLLWEPQISMWLSKQRSIYPIKD